MPDFVHLHVHTEYSLLDGAARIADLVSKAKASGQTALAITDHGAMYGVIAFYKECKKQGVKPLIGMEAYVAPRLMEEKQGKMDKDYAHLILLAKNKTGYKNLCMLSTLAFTKGKYYKPRIDYVVLEKYKEGLIALTACLSGDLPRMLLENRMDDAMSYAKRMKAMFDEDFYIEIQDHGIEEEKQIIPLLLDICEKRDIKPVCTNDVHYVQREDAQAQDVLMCIQTGKFIDDENRMRLQGSEFYLKSADEMAKLFHYCPESLANTLEVAQKCNLDFVFGKIHLPSYDVPEGYTHTGYLHELCMQGLREKCADKGKPYQDRLDYEFDVINQMGYTDYFLIVWDFVHYAKTNAIAVGPGRGSAAGSLCAYCLGITDIDPIKYGLLFERFLNPERVSMPDIDIDFCYERRQEVIDYVVRKYGEDHVTQIITFGTMAARAALRDVGRVLHMPYGDVDKLAKMVPQEIGITLRRALEVNEEFRAQYEAGGDAKQVIDLAIKVEGIPRNASTHAAGVVISSKPVVEYVPLQTNDDVVTTQFPMGIIEELGLLKMDFLGLRTLTVIRDTLFEIERGRRTPPDMENIPYDDTEVYELISSGDTDGVFQLESSGMRAFMQQLKPDKFEDIIAGISLFRPGPMDQIPKYVDCKFHPEHVSYAHALLEPILNVTYGCMVYQEQVMQIVRDLAGYSLGHSDLVRRAMAKKKKAVMEKEEVEFIKGCLAHGVSEKVAKDIFTQMMDFAQYAFNKSHAAAYAVIAYRTGWLKAHYRAEFMASLMNSFLGQSDKTAEYVYVCRKSGIYMLPPDINKSTERFTVENYDGQKAIRFGTAVVKSIGIGACKAIVEERDSNGAYKSFADFLERCEASLTKRMVANFINAGIFDSFGDKRAVLMGAYQSEMDSITNKRKRNMAGQVSLFDIMGEESLFSLATSYPDAPEYAKTEKLALEKEATGLYITGHPLSEYMEEIDSMTSGRDVLEAGKEGTLHDEQSVSVAGVVQGVRIKFTRRNDQMAYVTLEDLQTQIECIIFPRVLERSRELIQNDTLVVVNGHINVRDDDVNVLIVDSMAPLVKGSTVIKKAKAAHKSVEEGLYLRCTQEQLDKSQQLIHDHRGDIPVVFVVNSKGLKTSTDNWCDGSGQLIEELENLLDRENVKLIL